MRILFACIPVVLSFGLMASTGCSSSSSDGAAGAGGTAGSTAGSSGSSGASGSSSGSSGSSGSAGSAGTAGSGDCALLSDACDTCQTTNCMAEGDACQADTSSGGCVEATGTFAGCLCLDPPADPSSCTTAYSDSGATAKAVADCLIAHCKTECGI